MKKQNQQLDGIIFDFDDTLVFTNCLFNAARDICIKEVQKLGVQDNYEAIFQTIDRLDIEAVLQCGHFSPECFPQALPAAYRHYAAQMGIAADEATCAKLLACGRRVYDTPSEPVPDVHWLLADLQAKIPLVLLSQGDLAMQQKRIQESGLSKYFTEICIVGQKTEQVFRDLLARQGWQAAKTYMVGNSIRSDINPAQAAGLSCILVDVAPSWAFEDAEQLAPCAKVTSLRQCREILEQEVADFG